MAFQVTARRWRPQTFDEVIGQEHVTSTLKSAIEKGRIAHAYLFAGTRGVGKTTTARILAKALNCQQGPTPSPCNRCTQCAEVMGGNAIDVLEIDGASNRGIDEIRNLRENVRYAPVRGRYKVYIIDEVHMLTMHAFNALLKTLEEPPPHAVFIMATTEVARVPATIVSRCQRYDFRLIPQLQIKEQLKKIDQQDSLGVPSEVLDLIARSARGSMRDAQSLLDQLVSYGGGKVTAEEALAVLGLVDYDVLSACVEAILKRDAATLIEQVGRLRVNGRDIRQFCGQLLHYLRDLLVIKATGSASLLSEVPQERRVIMEGQAGPATLEQFHLLFTMLSRAESEMARASYPDLIMEMALIRMCQGESFMSLGEILSRLQSLEDRTEGEGSGAPGDTHEKQRSLLFSVGQEAVPSKKSGEASAEGRKLEPPLPRDTRRRRRLSDGDLWRRILEEAKKENHLEQYLMQGWLASVSQDAVQIGFPEEYKYTAQILSQSDKYTKLQEAVGRALGRSVIVRFTDSPKAEEIESGEGEEQVPGKPWNPMEEPIVKQMLSMFDGHIVDLRPERAPF